MLAIAANAWAQSGSGPGAETPRIVLPPVTVVAGKEPQPLDRVPASVTAVRGERLQSAGVVVTSEAAWFAPNTFYSDLSARKISNARFRGIGSSPSNPGITTFVDGVPQLNTNTANVDLLDVDQIEFVRGASSALFGRNTLGGVVNVTSRWPSLSRWTGQVVAPFGTEAERGLALSLSGPVKANRIGASLAVSATARDGYTVNTMTGSTVDDRSAVSMKGQIAFTPAGPWSARLIVAGERDRDGDYTLGDLTAIRAEPFRVARDFEGRTDRDLQSLMFAARREGARLTLTSTTGVLDWKTFDETDLDYSPVPLATRENRERALQFTQEIRVASSAAAPIALTDRLSLRWQAGVFGFTQAYDQDAANTYAPFVLSPQIGVPVASRSPQAALDDDGVGVYGQATTTWGERVDVSAGIRVDREHRTALLNSFFEPAIGPPTVVDEERTFIGVSPQVAVAFRPREGRTFYGSVGRGFKAGGFNPASTPGAESYGQEHAWHVEGGVKALAAGGRVSIGAAAFVIDWADLQLNVPNPAVPAQFYIANVGAAKSRGVELDVQARVHETLTLYGAFGATRARFADGSRSMGTAIAGNRVPSTPRFTVQAGAEFARPLRDDLSLIARADLVGYGAFEYDEFNAARQDAYALTNLRAGLQLSRVTMDVWVRNAFDTRYVPVAFAFDPAAAPSGYLGEPGRPRALGIRVGYRF